MIANIIDQGRRKRPLFLHPLQLIIKSVFILQDVILDATELFRIPGPDDRKTLHRNSIDHLLSLRIMVIPGDIIKGTSCQDFDFCIFIHVFGHPPAVQFRSSIDLQSIPLDDKSELHELIFLSSNSSGSYVL